MKIFGLMMVRNEADILQVNLLHHLAAGIDRFLVVDNGSSDGSDRILRELSRDGRVSWTRDSGKYRQAEITTELAHEARSAGADWIIPIDVDEFWYAPGGDLRGVLEACSAGGLEAQVTNFIQRRDQIRAEPSGLLHMTRRAPIPVGALEWIQELVEKKQNSYVEVTFPPKWISRAADSVEIAMGSHAVSGLSAPLESTDEIVCLHAPLHAQCVLEAKAKDHGKRVLELDLGLHGWWQADRWRRVSEAAELKKEWLANSYADERLDVYGQVHPVVYDPRLRDLVRPWVEQVMERAGAAASPAGPVTSHEPGNAEGAALSETETLRRRVQVLEELNDAAEKERSQLLHAIQIQLRAIPQERTRAIERRTQEVIVRDKMIRDLQRELHTKVGEWNVVIKDLHAPMQEEVSKRDNMIRDLQRELHTKVDEWNVVIKDLHAPMQEEVSKRDKMIRDLQRELHTKVDEWNVVIKDLHAPMQEEVSKRDKMIRDLQRELHTKVGECNVMIKDLHARFQEEISERDKLIGELQQRLHQQTQQQ